MEIVPCIMDLGALMRLSNKEVLLVAPLPPPVGGIATWAENLFAYARTQPEFLFRVVNSSVRRRNIANRSLLARLLGGGLDSVFLFFKFLRMLLFCQCSTVHITSSGSLGLFRDSILLLLARALGRRVILHFHFGRIPALYAAKNWEWSVLLQMVKLVHHSIVLDEESHNVLLLAGISSRRISIIPNPCSKELEVEASKSRVYFHRGYILFVGHIVRNKGIFELLKAVSMLEDKVNVEFIGPVTESFLKELNRLCESLGICSRVKFSGVQNRDYIYQRLNFADMLLLPSYSEGFPNVILEAMGCGCPVISTNVGAIPEMLGERERGPCGVCVPPKNVQALVGAIEYLRNRPALAKEFGENGKSRVLKKYSMAVVWKMMVDIWLG